MKVYVTTRFKDALSNKDDVEALCRSVRKAGLIDFNFVRDVENYTSKFKNQTDLWNSALNSLKSCDLLLIDVSDNPSGGRVIEAGMAFALNIPIITTVKKDISYKPIYDGISRLVIKYNNIDDITSELIRYVEPHN